MPKKPAKPQKYLKLAVENFGPIRKGEFELKPLTIFIGPNNSGKSYMAVLLYALCKALTTRMPGPVHRDYQFGWPVVTFGGWPRQPTGRRSGAIVQNLPEPIQQKFRSSFHQSESILNERIWETLRDYFAYSDARDLLSHTAPKSSFTVKMNPGLGDGAFVTMKVDGVEDKRTIEWLFPQGATVSATRRQIEQLLEGNDGQPLPAPLWSALLQANDMPQQQAYYLPPARSGILQAWPLFASLAVQIVRRGLGLERIEVPALTGVTGDFLQVLLERITPQGSRQVPLFDYMPFFEGDRKNRATMRHLAQEVLEGALLGGQVSIETPGPERPSMTYKSHGVALPLQRASSMVAELAPLDLWIKDLIRPGDLLVIDEPEAHLHPENQRRIAKVLVRLAKAGVRVLCPTHSSLILHQVSNHILAAGADIKTRDELGLTEDDLLSPDDVGVYLFDLQEDGSEIKPVPIEPGFGIHEDEFLRVAEAIGDETYRLTIAAQRPG